MGGLRVVLVALGVLAAAVAHAGDEPVTMRAVKPVAHGIEAFPRIGTPRDAAVARINHALAGADASVDRLAVDCNHYKGWHRGVQVTMRGPRYVSLLAGDDWYCGGAYPDTDLTALVFDLSTGAPVDWTKLFPPALVDAAGPSPGGGVSDPIFIPTRGLWDLFVKTANSPGDECNEVRNSASDMDTSLMIWPDAKEDGIALAATQFPHVVKACSGPATVPVAELRKLGVDAALLDAIDEAHAKGWYDGGK
ncbi:MAG TPA: hypothetical protein VHW66_02920 [Stellaceae bacterium]|jgi:hypothetical protein|nr:hypothetical protein [Stellaceae bacterium]